MTIVHGSDDPTVPIEASRNLKERFPDVTFVEVDGGDHRLNGALSIHVTADCGEGEAARAKAEPPAGGGPATTAALAPKTLREMIEDLLQEADEGCQ